MMTFVVTLAAFPALVVLVVSEDVPSVWNGKFIYTLNCVMEYYQLEFNKTHVYVLVDKYYHPVVSFLVFACGDYLGRIFSGSLKLVCMCTKMRLFVLKYNFLTNHCMSYIILNSSLKSLHRGL